MKQWIVRHCLAAGLLLPFPMAGQAQVATISGRETFDPKAPEPANPSQMYIASVVEYTIGVLHKHHEKGWITGLSEGFHYDLLQWQQPDATEYARCPKTYSYFETLLGLGNQAVETGRDGQYTQKALEAQQALTYLKPACCKSWKGFCNMIATAADATQVLRDSYRKHT